MAEGHVMERVASPVVEWTSTNVLEESSWKLKQARI